VAEREGSMMLEDICNVKIPNGFRLKIEVYGKDEVDEHSKTLHLTLEDEDFRRIKNAMTADFCLYGVVTLQYVVDSMLKELK
jgi:hypothetical protein